MAEIQPKKEPADGLTDTWKTMVAFLRKSLRDFAPLNRLLANEESKDSDLVMALMTCMSDINGTPPITNYTLQQIIDSHQIKLLLDGAACNIIEEVVLHYARNEIKFTDAGVSIAVSDKAGALLRWFQLKKSEYEQKKKSFKIAKNVESIMGASDMMTHSEYYQLFNYLRNNPD